MADSNQNDREKEFIRNEKKKRDRKFLKQVADCISRSAKKDDIIFAIPNETKHLANWTEDQWFFNRKTELFKLDYLICEPTVFFADSLLNSYIYHLFDFLELIGPETKIVCISKEEHFAVQRRLVEAGFRAEYDIPFTHVCTGTQLVKVELEREKFVWRFNPNEQDLPHTDSTRDMMVILKMLVDELKEHGYYDMFSPMPSIGNFAKDVLNKALEFPAMLNEIRKLQEMNVGGIPAQTSVEIPAQRSLTPEEEVQRSRHSPRPSRPPGPPPSSSRDPVRQRTPPQREMRQQTPPQDSERSFPSDPNRGDRKNPFPSTPPRDSEQSFPSNASRRDDRRNPFPSKRNSRSPKRGSRPNPFPPRHKSRSPQFHERVPEPLRREEGADPFPFKRNEPSRDQFERSPRKPPRGGNRARRKAGPGRDDPLHRRAEPPAPFERERRSYERDRHYSTQQPSPPRNNRYSNSRTPERTPPSRPIRGRGNKRKAGYNAGRPRDIRHSPSPRNSPPMDDYHDDDDDSLSYDSATGDYCKKSQMEKKKARKPPPAPKQTSARGTGGGRGTGRAGRGGGRGRVARGRRGGMNGRGGASQPRKPKAPQKKWYNITVSHFYRDTGLDEFESWLEDDAAVIDLQKKI